MKHSKLLSIVLVLALVLSLAVMPAYAADAEYGDEILTRGEFVMGLYQLAEAWDGEAKQDSFDDVPAEGDLALAVSWAVANEIIYGYGNRKFGPDDPVTREQMATMLYRNAKLYGQGFQGMWYFPLDFPDAAEVSDWADEAMHWVVMEEIIIGTDKGLEPKALATDDQLALVLERWQKTVNAPEEAQACSVTISTDGSGRIAYAAEGEELDLDGERFTSLSFSLEEPTTLTFGARADQTGWYFVKWMMNGSDCSAEEVFTYQISADTELVAVFDRDPYLGEFADEDGNKALEIGLTANGTHSVSLNIVRLASFDDGEGNMSDGGLRFMATDPNGNPIFGMINLDAGDPAQDTLIVAITDSTWELLPNGTEFRYTRIIPKEEQFGSAGSKIPLKDNLLKAKEQVLATVERYLRDAWAEKIDDIEVTVEKVYSAEEEAAIDVLKDMGLGPNEVAFSVNYKLHPAEGVEDLLQFTAATGEIDEASGWIINKSNVGILRPDPDGSGYIVTDFGTGF